MRSDAANDDRVPTLTRVTIPSVERAAIHRAINENNAAVKKLVLRCDQIQQTIDDIKSREIPMPTEENPTILDKAKALYGKIPPNLRPAVWCILIVLTVAIVL